MKILVTGGAGFIASYIVDAYLSSGYNVVVIDNLSTGRKEFINPKATFYQVDIRNKKEIETILNKERPDVINHHAAQISVRYSVSNPLNDLEVNLIGLLNLLEPAKKIGLKKFIFASSGGVVYGEASVIPTPESYTPLKPQSPYGVTKLASEYYLNYYYQNFKIPFIALRYSNVYGPRQNPYGEAGVIAIFTKKLINSETPIINGDGKQSRDYIFVKDVVEVNKIALATDKIGTFNIGTGEETNVIEIYENIKRSVGSYIKAKHAPPRTGEQKRSCLDCSLAKKALDWKHKIDLISGLNLTIDYFRQHST